MTETIYIERHGFRLNWITNDWKSETGLPRDPPLAAYGEAQAKETADYFLALPADERPTAIFSSPYYRCLQTATPVAEALGLPIYVEHGLSEWYSPAAPGTGLHPRPAAPAALRRLFPRIDPAWTPVFYPSRRGEDVPALRARAAGTLAALLPEAARRLGRARARRVLLVSHAATAIALAQALAGGAARPLRVGCCTLTVLARAPGGEAAEGPALGGWAAGKWADGGHLKGGVERDWGFEDAVVEDGKVVDDHGEPGTENELDEPVGPQVPISSSL